MNWMSNCRSHRYTLDEEGSHRMEKKTSGDFYDKLQASQMSNMTNWMSNYRSHRYTSDGESTMWRSMTKPFVIDGIAFITYV
jgi:hypothetical protein